MWDMELRGPRTVSEKRLHLTSEGAIYGSNRIKPSLRGRVKQILPHVDGFLGHPPLGL